MRFINREIPVEGRDFCDMSGDYSKPLSDFSIVNIMLPRKYHPSLKDNVYEVRPAVTSCFSVLASPINDHVEWENIDWDFEKHSRKVFLPKNHASLLNLFVHVDLRSHF